MVTAPSLTVQEMFGQYTWAQVGIVGMSCTGPGVGFDAPDGFLPAQHIL